VKNEDRHSVLFCFACLDEVSPRLRDTSIPELFKHWLRKIEIH
jgi:hypothetical protein